ncbi:MAG: hypothetical protein KJ587_20195 [Alphaproteobacteria bacterium]|nr:hypothetical protein [Alphaproteobacteria bacterium]
MFYKYELEILTTNTKSNPAELEIKLPFGVIHHVEIYFPPGCEGEAKAKIEHAELQIWPSNPKEWFAGDEFPIVFNEDYRLEEDFNILKLYGYNDDTVNSHTVTFRIGVKGEWRLYLEGLGQEVVI